MKSRNGKYRTRRIVASFAAVTTLASGMAFGASAAIADTGTSATANNLTLLAGWDFTDKYKSENGTIADSTGKYDMTLHNGAYVEKFGDRNQSEALQLKGDSKQYAEIDSSLFKDAGNTFTVEFAAKSRHSDDGKHFSFTVGKDRNKYLMYYGSTDSIKTVISDDTWRNEQGGKVAVSNNNNVWHNYKLVVDGTKLAVFRDNALIIYKEDTGITMNDLESTVTYIGKSFYDEDNYWNGAMDDLKVYKGAEPINVTTSVTVAGADKVGEGESTQLTATVAPEDAVDKNLTWASSDTSVATVDSEGKVTGVKGGSATITATNPITGVKGEKRITVAELSDWDKAKADVDAVVAKIATTTTENLPLVTEGEHGTSIVWTSSDTKLITPTNTKYSNPNADSNVAADPYKDGGVISRPAYGDGDAKATLTAMASVNGKSASKQVEITVKEKTRTAPDEGYAAANFKSDDGNDERIWMSSTEGQNFFSFKVRNNGNAVLANDADTGGLRDAYILRSHDGDAYYMIATDLKVHAAGAGWGNVQTRGSTKVEVYESKDLMNWTRTNGDGNGGIIINDEYAGMTWAPEAYWDDDLNAYVVFFSSRMYNDKEHTDPVKNSTTGNSSYAQVRYSITRDFVNFTAPQKWQDTGYARIDSTVMKIGEYYYRFTKNEQSGAAGEYITTGKSIFLERSKHLTAPTTKADPNQDPETGWQLLEQNLLPFEGPEVVKLNKDDPINTKDDDGYILLSDNFNYRAFMTTGKALSETNWNNTMLSRYPDFNNEKKAVKAESGAQGFIASGSNGGLPSIVRHGAFVNVPQTVLDVMKTWTTDNPTTIQAVDSSVTVRYDAEPRVLTATVFASDKGTVAGSVKFTVGDWTSNPVKLVDGVAQITVPNTVSGSVAEAAYDGYTDGLVKASSGSVSVVIEAVKNPEPSLSSDATLTSLSVGGKAVDLVAAAKGTATVQVADPSKVVAEDVDYVLTDKENANAEVAVSDNVVTVTVTAQDGTVKVYKVTLTKAQDGESGGSKNPDGGSEGSGNGSTGDGSVQQPNKDASGSVSDDAIASTGITIIGVVMVASIALVVALALLGYRKRRI